MANVTDRESEIGYTSPSSPSAFETFRHILGNHIFLPKQSKVKPSKFRNESHWI